MCKREIRSHEVTAFLRKVICSLGSESRALQVSSHSLKRTTLSWGSKYGLTQDEKSILGRHASATLGSQAVYSVDLASAPARALQKVILDIASGSFRPDNPIASYFKPQPNPVSALPVSPNPPVGPQKADAVPVKLEVEPAAQDENPQLVCVSSSESDSSSSSDESSSEESLSFKPQKAAKLACPWKLEETLQHSKSRICHMVTSHTGGGRPILACGKMGSEKFVRPKAQSEVRDICRNCRRIQATLNRS